MRRVSFGPFDSLFFLVLSVHLVLWSRCFAVRLDWPTTEADQRERGRGAGERKGASGGCIIHPNLSTAKDQSH